MSEAVLHFNSGLHAARVRHLASRLSEAESSLCNLTAGGVDAILDDAGNPYLLRAAQERFRRKELRGQALLDGVPDVIIAISLSGKVLFQNAAVTHALGYDPDELVGLNIFKFVHPEDVRKLNHAIFGVTETFSTEASVGFRFLAHEGTWRTFEAAIGRLIDPPDPQGLILALRDSSRRREDQEDALRQKIARESELFLAMLYQELQTPLAPALRGVRVLLERAPALAVKPILEMIRCNLELQSRLLDDLLDLTSINGRAPRSVAEHSASLAGEDPQLVSDLPLVRGPSLTSSL